MRRDMEPPSVMDAWAHDASRRARARPVLHKRACTMPAWLSWFCARRPSANAAISLSCTSGCPSMVISGGTAPRCTIFALKSGSVVANCPSSSAASRWLSVHLDDSSPITGCSDPSSSTCARARRARRARCTRGLTGKALDSPPARPALWVQIELRNTSSLRFILGRPHAGQGGTGALHIPLVHLPPPVSHKLGCPTKLGACDAAHPR